ncbi:hypothetical protein BBFL7_01990 [Flavobacteria bacterium BBFL7]|nr:hypothetical protein BBFL7_01990 [Flavobacteria bacterium BBFL7]
MSNTFGLLLIVVLFNLVSCKRNDKFRLSQFSDSITKDTIYESNKAFKSNDSLISNSKISIPDSLLIKHYLAAARWSNKRKDFDNTSLYYQKTLEIAISNSTIKEDRLVLEIFNFYRQYRRSGDLKALVYQLDKKKDTTLSYKAFVLNVKESQELIDKNFEASLSLNKERVRLLTQLDAQEHINDALINRVQYYYYYLNDKTESYKLLDSLLLHKKKFTKKMVSDLYSNYGVFMFYDGNYNRSLELYIDALHFARSDSLNPLQEEVIATSVANIVEVQIKLGNYNEAKKYFKEFYSLDQTKLNNDIKASVLKYQLRYTYRTKKSLIDLEQALDSLIAFHIDDYKSKSELELEALKSSTEKTILLTEQNKQFEVEQLKTQAGWIITVAIFLLVAVLLYILYLKRNNNLRLNALLMQQRLLRSQLNPHFTFNTLYSIQNLIISDHSKASKYLQKFTRLLRGVLENSLQDYVQLENEILALEEYLLLQQLRFPDKFDYNIKFVGIDIEDLVYIPPMLIQPFVENSLEHGFKDLSYQGFVEITLSLNLKKGEHKIQYIDCEIVDNGLGFQEDYNNNKRSTSFQLINDFIKKSTGKAIQINSKKYETIVSFTIPVKQ